MALRDEFVQLSKNEAFEIKKAEVDQFLTAIANGVKGVILQKNHGVYKDHPLAKKEHRYCYYVFIAFVEGVPNQTWTCHKPDDSYSEYKFVKSDAEIGYFFSELLDVYDAVSVVVEPNTNTKENFINSPGQAVSLIRVGQTIKLSVYLNCDEYGEIRSK